MGDFEQEQERLKKITEFSEAFQLFDKDLDLIIESSDMGLLLRSLNRNPTEFEIEEFIKKVDPDDTGRVEHADFITHMQKEDEDPEEELREALRTVFQGNVSSKDKDQGPFTGIHSINTLKYQMQDGQESFNTEEIEQLIKELDPSNTTFFDIEHFIRVIIHSMQQ